MAQPGGKPKPAFFIAVVAVIAALVAFAVMRGSSKSKKSNGGGSGTAKVSIEDIKKQASTPPDREPSMPGEQYLPPVQSVRKKYWLLRSARSRNSRTDVPFRP